MCPHQEKRGKITSKIFSARQKLIASNLGHRNQCDSTFDRWTLIINADLKLFASDLMTDNANVRTLFPKLILL